LLQRLLASSVVKVSGARQKVAVTMTNKKQLWAVVAFLTIPVIWLAGGALFAAIDPEKLAGHTHYVRNYRLLELVRGGIMLAMFGAAVVAWFVTCLLVLRSRCQPYQWLLLALLGPIGLVFLASLPNLNPDPSDLHERFVRRLRWFFRVAYEIAFFVLVWSLSWQMMSLKHEAMISLHETITGLSRDQVLDQLNDQSAMWAFGELNDVAYFFALLYLLRPICVNVVGSMFKPRGSSEVA
jgi:hypothetical protein